MSDINPQLKRLVDFLDGKEGQQDDVGAVARWVKGYVESPPAETRPASRAAAWSSVGDMKYCAHLLFCDPRFDRLKGIPGCALDQIDVAVAAEQAEYNCISAELEQRV